MCIAIVSTAHPDYELIVLSNRDEFLHRPTARATWWDPPHAHVLGGRDLHRAVRGTWLGITRQGRFAVLTNFREDHDADATGRLSRGGIVNDYLTLPPDSTVTPEQWADDLVARHGVRGVGGFSLMFGWLRGRKGGDDANDDANDDAKGGHQEPPSPRGKRGLAIISNRTPDARGLVWLATARDETRGLSNSHFGDRGWPKVTNGEALLAAAVAASRAAGEGEDALRARCFGVLSTDTLPARQLGEEWATYAGKLRESVFVPVVGDEVTQGRSASQMASGRVGETGTEAERAAQRAAEEAERKRRRDEEVSSGLYGTSKQTVILVRRDGSVSYVERTLYESDGKTVAEGNVERKFEFDIEGW